MKQRAQFIAEQTDMVISECRKQRIDIPDTAEIALSKYIAKLMEWNTRFNLVSKGAIEFVGRRHILDSLSVLSAFQPENDASMVDFGSGAGFPAIPLKIFRPDLRMTLVESRRKKTLFLKAMRDLLAFENFEVICDRIENVGIGDGVRDIDGIVFDRVDFVTARAVASPVQIGKLAIPFLKSNGKLVLFLGPNDSKEVEAISQSLGTLGYVPLIVKRSPFADMDFNIMVAMKTEQIDK